MRKLALAYAKTKAQISCAVAKAHAADQCVCFRYIDSTIHLVFKSDRRFMPLIIFYNNMDVQSGLCRTWSEIPDWFSCDETQFLSMCEL